MTVIHIRRMRERGIARVGLGDGAKDDEEDSRGQEARGKREELEAHDSAQSREHIGYVCGVTATPSRISTMY